MKHVFLIIIFTAFVIGFNGCSWVTKDYSYVPIETDSDWHFEFFPGYQKSVKHAPVPDKAVLSLDSNDFSIEISSGYTERLSSGPLWFPIIPNITDATSNQSLKINVTVTSKSLPIIIDCSKFSLFLNGNFKEKTDHLVHINSPQPINFSVRYTADDYPIISLAPYRNAKIAIVSSEKQCKIYEFKLIINGMMIDGKHIPIMPLKLKKESGHINYDEFTI